MRANTIGWYLRKGDVYKSGGGFLVHGRQPLTNIRLIAQLTDDWLVTTFLGDKGYDSNELVQQIKHKWGNTEGVHKLLNHYAHLTSI